MPWAGPWRRRQQLYSRLARHRPVFHFDSPFSPLDFARGRRTLQAWIFNPAAIRSEAGGVEVVTGALGLPAARFMPPVQLANARIQRHWAGRCLARLRQAHILRRPIVICYDPLLHPLGALQPARVVYDLIDDYASLAPSPWLGRIVDRRMRDLAAAADLTLAVNEALAARIEGSARRLELLPHGADPVTFHPEAWRGTPFESVKHAPGIKAVFAGHLGKKLDLEILTALARSGVTLLLAGELALEQRPWRRLLAAGPVRYFGLLSVAEVAALLAAADVGLLPYREQAGVVSVNALKRFELQAAGLPIVATDMPAARPFAGEIRLADGPGPFVAAVREAAAEAADNRVRRHALARADSWDVRVERMEAWLRAWDGMADGREV